MKVPTSLAKPLTRLRKRPSQKRALSTFAAVIEAAAHILRGEGLRGLTTNRVAERAGVSIGSLYQYFPNKEAIVRALMEKEIAAAEALRPPILDDLKAPLESRIRALVDWRCEVASRDQGFGRSLQAMTAQILSKSELRRFEAFRRERATRAIAAWLSDQPQRDPALTALVVDAVLAALIDGPGQDQLTRDPIAFKREMVLMLTSYLGKPLK
jgi:AcrR family transcriptional regulator